MSYIPKELLYAQDHGWILADEDGTALAGITDYAQESLGDITFVELPSLGESFNLADTIGVIESVKVASDLFMPIDAEVLEINQDVDSEPELLNSDPYKKGWLLEIRIIDSSQVDDLHQAKAYAELV